MIPTFHTTCLSKKLIASGVYEIHLQKPEGFQFQSGQFVLFDVPLPNNENDIQTRAYSIASIPSEQDLLFVIKLVPHGRASAWIESQVTEGTSITMKGPFGAFLLDEATDKPYLFLATGTGVAPLRSQMLHALKERRDTRPMQLVCGVVHEADLFGMEEWKTLMQEHPNVQVHSCVLETDGPMQEKIPSLVKDFNNVSVYICGAPVTIQDLKARCAEWGVPKEDVHAESYV